MNEACARRDLLVTLSLLVLLVFWEASGADLALARVYGGAAGFALRDDWFFSRVMHDGGRWLSLVALFTVAAWATLGNAGVMAHRQRWTWVAVVLLCLVAVPALKRLSSTSCPWSLDVFGGAAAYVPHWMVRLTDGGPGHCFPSGHAVAAFAFLPLYFQWRQVRPRVALALLATTLTVGGLFGWAQLARGAHFPSHTMWSAWLCWALGVAAARELGVGQPSSMLSINRIRPDSAAASATSASQSAGTPNLR